MRSPAPADVVDGVLDVLRASLNPAVIESRMDTLVQLAAIQTRINTGDSPVEAVGLALKDAIGQMENPRHRAACEVMAGIAEGWTASDIERSARIGEEALLLSTRTKIVGRRRVEQIERGQLVPALIRILSRTRSDKRGPELRPVFVQVINPEICAFYGQRDIVSDPQGVRRRLDEIARLAIMITRGGIVFPASYLGEVVGLHDWLNSNLGSTMREHGLISLTGPVRDLAAYTHQKRREYRDDQVAPYRTRILTDDGLNWRPRHASSAASDITATWLASINNEGGLRPVVRYLDHRRRGTGERTVGAVPDRLEGRAFISRFVVTVIGGLPSGVRAPIDYLVSRAYLESYLREADAILIHNFAYGPYSLRLLDDRTAGVARLYDANHVKLWLSWLGLSDFTLRHAQPDDLIDFSRSIEWDVLSEMVFQAIPSTNAKRRLMQAVNKHAPGGGGEMDHAIRLARASIEALASSENVVG